MTPMLTFAAYAILVIVAIYLFVYIPNKKKHRKAQELHSSIAVGDVVITIGGLVGRVKEREENYVTLVIDEEKDITAKVVLYAIGQIKEKHSN